MQRFRGGAGLLDLARGPGRLAQAMHIDFRQDGLIDGGARSLALLGDRGWGAVLAVATASLLLGWLFGGHDEGPRRTLALSANAKEIGLALTMASVAFPQGHVRLAIFAVWATFAFLDLAFLTAIGRPSLRGRRQHA